MRGTKTFRSLGPASLLLMILSATAWAQCEEIVSTIQEAKQALTKVKLKRGSHRQSYNEGDGSKANDWEWKEVALVVMQPQTGESRTLKIVKRGITLDNSNPEFEISAVPRATGLVWNAYNTHFSVRRKRDNSAWAVIALKWPLFKSLRYRGKRFESVIYSPFSDALANSSCKEVLVNEGRRYLHAKIEEALRSLPRLRPRSGLQLPELISADLLYRLVLVEHCDLLEFRQNVENAIDRVRMLVGANGEDAYNFSTEGPAFGLAQVTKDAYADMRKEFGNAALPWDFEWAARDHAASLRAAILECLHDQAILRNNLRGQEFMPDLGEVVAAAYNCGVGDVLRAVREGGREWVGRLHKETQGYVEKYREVRELTRDLQIQTPLAEPSRATQLELCPDQALSSVQGGSEAVLYLVSRNVERSGVIVGDRFCRGYPAPELGQGAHLALFSLGLFQAGHTPISLLAEGEGGRPVWEMPLNVAVNHAEIREMQLQIDTPFIESVAEDIFRRPHAGSRWIEFWRNLKEGYDRFDTDRVPPEVTVRDRRYVFSRAR